jgi:class 3 adenylate cyclase/TolB-like protein
VSDGERTQRRLAAIVAADVAGYSRLVGEDEEGTLSALRAHRAELIDPLLQEHGGRIANTAGDSYLLEFPSAVDAVRCVIALQEGVAERNAGIDPDKHIQFRVGINVGDVVAEGDDLLGDGVNVAARLEGIAEPGGIYISRMVRDSVRDRMEIDLEDMGDVEVKNIARPVRVFRVATATVSTAGSPPVAEKPGNSKKWPVRVIAALAFAAVFGVGLGGWFVLQTSATPAIPISGVMTVKGPAIAALQFENISGDTRHNPFARGLTEQVAAALTRFKGLRVLSRTIVQQNGNDISKLRKLGADYVLTGNVLRSESTVRVTVTLSDTVSGDQIWADTFDATLTAANIIGVQDLLAGKVVSAIASGDQSALNLDRLKDARGKPPEQLSALDCVLAFNSWTSPEQLVRAHKCIIPALKQDPSYAEGWETLSNIYVIDYLLGYQLRKDNEYDPRALSLEAGQNAVDLAPSSARAHWALSRAHFINGQLERFRQEAALSAQLNPNDANSISQNAQFLAYSGRWDEGVALTMKALDFNPSVINPSVYYTLAKSHFVKDEYEAAMENFRRTFAPGFWLNDLVSAYTYGAWGKHADARKSVAQLLKKIPSYTVEDAADFYRKFQFQDSDITKMTNALPESGLPSRGTGG